MLAFLHLEKLHIFVTNIQAAFWCMIRIYRFFYQDNKAGGPLNNVDFLPLTESVLVPDQLLFKHRQSSRHILVLT